MGKAEKKLSHGEATSQALVCKKKELVAVDFLAVIPENAHLCGWL